VIREAKLSEVREVTTYMKKFEKCTKVIPVDIEHTIKKYTDLISRGVGHMFILEDEKGIMRGGLGCIVCEDFHFPRTIAVETYWYVEPEYSGHGKELVDFFEKWAKETAKCQYTAMIHLADSHPERLQKFYEKNGYRLVEQHFVKELL
jgi:GNAT superfamily N-acetyltransferase